MASNRDWYPVGEPGEMPDVKCAYCYGAGKDPFGLPGPESNCAVCGGKGYNRVMAPYVRCAACGGTGQARGRRLSCTTCKGRGVTTVRVSMVTCPQCKGTGRQPDIEHDLACTLCGGRGRVDRRKQAAGPTASAVRHAPAVSPPPPPPAARPAPPPLPPEIRPAPSPPTASAADQIAAYVNSIPGVRPLDLQVIFDLSAAEMEQILQDLVQARRIRQKEDGLYYST